MDIIFTLIVLIIIISVWSSSARSALPLNRNSNDIGWNIPLTSQENSNYIPLSQRKSSRKHALQKAQLFLKPYEDLMGEHCLTNEYCKVNLVIDKNEGKKIICISKDVINGKRKFLTAKVNYELKKYYSQPLDYVIDFFWDNICKTFTYSTVYENISSAAATALLTVNETEIGIGTQNKSIQPTNNKNLLNINSALESELLALPGVNIIIAKKALKYIEKNNGFKSVEEFIEKMKIKDSFAEQIKSITYTGSLYNTNGNQKAVEKTIESENIADNSSSDLDIFEDTQPQTHPDSNNERIVDL